MFSLIGEGEGESTIQEAGKSIGRFTLIQQVGQGSFGSVWKARDPELDRFVAIKIPRKKSLDASESGRFFREAQAAAQLRHRYIVSLHEVGRADGEIFIVSDFVVGSTLADHLKLRSFSGRESAALVEKVADALEHAHEAGVIHRDLKPSNILIDDKGEPYLTDFGLAKRELEDVTMTLDGTVLGTPLYMSPEQAKGDSHAVDRRSDLYSAGVVLYQLLTGELPFRGNPRMLTVQLLNDDPPNPRRLNSSIHRDLETICLKCLEKEPSKRYQTAQQLRDDLHRFLSQRPIQARPVGKATHFIRWCQRNTAVAGLIVAVVSALLIGLIASSYLVIQLQTSNWETKKALGESLLANSAALRKERIEGYGEEVKEVIHQIRALGHGVVPLSNIHQEAVGIMGDFVALPPLDLADFPEDVSTIAWHPTGRSIAIGFVNGLVQFFDSHDGTPLGTATAGEGRILCMAFNDSGEQLKALSEHVDEKLRLAIIQAHASNDWSEASHKMLTHTCRYAKFDRHGSRLLTWDSGNISIWDSDLGAKIATVAYSDLSTGEIVLDAADEGAIGNAVLSPDGRLLVVAYDFSDESVNERGFVVWDIERRQQILKEVLNLGGFAPHASAFSPTGDMLAFGCDEAFLLYEVPSFRQKLLIRQDSVKAVDISPDGQFFAIADIRGSVSMRALQSGSETAALTHRIPRQSGQRVIRFSGNSKFLAESNASGVRIWNLGGCLEKRYWESHHGAIPTLAFDPRASRLATGSKDQLFRLHDAASGKRMLEISVGGAVQSVRFNPSGTRVAVADWGGENRDVTVYDPTNGQLVARAVHNLEFVLRLAFIDDQHLAASGMNGIVIWDLNDVQAGPEGPAMCEPEEVIRGDTCREIAVGPAAGWIAWTDLVDRVPRVRVWAWKDPAKNPRYLQAPPMLQCWHGLAFSPDAQFLFFVSDKGRLIKWDMQEDRLASTFGEDNAIQGPHIALSPDGKLLAALYQQDAVSIWSTESGKRVFAFRPERTAIWSMTWNGDSSELFLGLNDGGLVSWDLTAVNSILETFGLSDAIN